MEKEFLSQSDKSNYYHSYWVTKCEPNLIPTYKPGPLHFIYLDYPSGSNYAVASLETINLNGKWFYAMGLNTSLIRVIGNMWVDSFSRPYFKEAEM